MFASSGMASPLRGEARIQELVSEIRRQPPVIFEL